MDECPYEEMKRPERSPPLYGDAVRWGPSVSQEEGLPRAGRLLSDVQPPELAEINVCL